MSRAPSQPPTDPFNPPGAPAYLCNMSRCLPAQALSTTEQEKHWCLYPYETCDGLPGKGTLMGAASYVTVPPVTLPLHRSGWNSCNMNHWATFPAT